MENLDAFSIVSDAWSTNEYLTLNEAAALWIGETPPVIWIDDHDDPQYDPDGLPINSFNSPELFKKILLNICEAISVFVRNKNREIISSDSDVSTQLPTEVRRKLFGGDNEKISPLKPHVFHPAYIYDDEGENTREIDYDRPNPNLTTIARLELVKWSIATNQCPAFLKKEINELVPYLNRTPDLPPYLNPHHEYFKEELKIAVETWLHFFDGKKFTPTGAPKEPYRQHLKKHQPHLKNETIERICTLINPITGGRPKKPKKTT